MSEREIGTATYAGPLSPAAEESSEPAVSGLPLGLIGHPRYRVIAMLGSGGMGSVYLAEHRMMKRQVALKVIRPDRIQSPAAIDRFLREAQAIARVSHPNVVAAHDAEGIDGLYLLVMEYVEGLDLDRLVKSVGPLPTPDACALVRQAAEGLQSAHTQGIVHRDLKPANLMLAQDGTLKVLDLGLAQLQEEPDSADDARLTSTGQLMGTPDYMAPEQCLDPRVATPATDVYSLGCTLYHLLNGTPPFHDARSSFEKMRAQRETPPPSIRTRRPHLPIALAELLERMVAKEPAARPGSMREVADGLAPFCLGANLARLLDQSQRVTSAEDVKTTEPASKRDPVVESHLTTRLAPKGFQSDSDRRARSPRRRTVWIVSAASAAALALGLAGFGWLHEERVPEAVAMPPKANGDAVAPETSTPAGPLRITALHVGVYRSRGSELLGLGSIGAEVNVAQVGDQLRVRVELSAPGYAYVLALNTDGKVQLTLPESQTEPPPNTARLMLYDDPSSYFTLTEGVREQAFVVIASRAPLPAYRLWAATQPVGNWETDAPSAGVWRYDGERFDALHSPRSSAAPAKRGQKKSLVPGPFVRACRSIASRAGVDAVEALAFPVRASAPASRQP